MKNKPTKRDIMIVEDFVKKTTKTIMKEVESNDSPSKTTLGAKYEAEGYVYFGTIRNREFKKYLKPGIDYKVVAKPNYKYDVYVKK